MNKFTSFVIGFVSGVAAGSITGILFAPNDGRDTRDRISFQISRLIDRLRELVEEKEKLENEAKNRGLAHTDKTRREAKKILAEFERAIKLEEDKTKRDENSANGQ